MTSSKPAANFTVDTVPDMQEVQYWQEMFEAYLARIPHSDGSHDLSHFRRVWQLAQKLSSDCDDKLVILAACYFHDFVSYPKNHPKRSQSSRDAAMQARGVLLAMGFPEEKLDSVCHCIEAHSFSANIETRTNEAKVVQDADRMEALGAIGLARTFYVAGKMGSELFCPEDPFAENRAPDDRQFAVDHFETKLLKLAATMKTSAGKDEAEKRSAVLRRFLDDLRSELMEDRDL
jgi:uncharacterized protein